VCGEEYDETRNLGSWACAQHSEPANPRTGIHACCGALWRRPGHWLARGCQAADHSERPEPWTRWHDATVTGVDPASILDLKPEAIIAVGEEGYFREMRVRRFADPALAIYRK